MKQVISNYSFNTTSKTVTLSDFSTIRLDRLQLIVDVTTNKVLYNFSDSTIATATVATNVVTLSTLQGGEANTDKLQVYYDALTGDPTYDTPSLPSNAAKETGGNLAGIKTDADTLAGTVSGGKVLTTETNSSAMKTDLDTVSTNTTPLVTAAGGGYVRQDSTATIAKESGGNLATITTNTTPLVTAAGGGYVRQDSTATIAKESGGNLATINTNTAPLVVSTAGGYVRQDSTGTIAKESGGNLATIATTNTDIDTATGTTADVAVTSDVNGTVSAKLRGLVKMIADVWDSTNHFLKISQATLISGEDQTNNVMRVEQQFNYAYISSATTTTIKSGAGFLHTITVVGGTAGTITVDDATSATTPNIAVFDSTNAIATYTLDVKFSNGLTIVTGAATKLVVSYR